jgi:hypothetical protein
MLAGDDEYAVDSQKKLAVGYSRGLEHGAIPHFRAALSDAG